MPEPIAVAFVEVRPEVDEFKVNAEQELKQGLGSDGLQVKGQFALEGLDKASRDVGQLTRDLRGVSGQQLQFEGLADAGRDADLLTSHLREAAGVNLAGTLAPAADEVAQLSTEARGLTEALSGIPGQIAPNFGDLGAASEQTAELAEATTTLGSSLGTTAGAASTLIDLHGQLAGSERQLAQATAEETRQVRLSANEEEKLIRVRSRRAQTVGPFRLAGIGLGVGTAIFAATRAIGTLSEGLRVGGNDALTFEGRMRNLGAAVLSGDIVGAFTALNNRTRDFSAEAVLAIDRSDQLAKSLKEAGIALNEIAGLAESRLKAAEQFTQVPPRFERRIAEAQLGGNTGGELEALRQADADALERIAAIKALNLTQAQTNVALTEVFKQRKSIADQIADITKESRPDILGPLVEAVTDARLTGDSQAILGALRNEAARLREVIAASTTNAADRRTFKDALVGVNRDIESTQDQIVAEVERHAAAMLAKQLQPIQIAGLQAELAGNVGGQIAALRQEFDVQQAIIDNKKSTQAQIQAALAAQVQINGQIESLQDGLTAEAQRHSDAMQQKRADADQAFLDAVGGREQRARNRQVLVQATATLNDDIKLSNDLQAIFKESIAAARKTIRDAALRAETIAALTQQLLQETQNERGLRQQQRTERITRREESLDLDIQLAQANDNKGAELKAHRAKITFLQERIRHTREGTNQRKRLIVELRQEQAAVRDLIKAGKDESEDTKASFSQLAFSFLQERRGFLSNIASNVQPTGGTPGLLPPRQPEPAAAPSPPPPPKPPAAVPSPLARGADRGDQGAAAQALRDQGGTPPSSGQLETLIHVGRTTNRLLGDIKSGVGHQDGKTARQLARSGAGGGEVSVS